MNIPTETKQKFDNMTYIEMLRIWRFAWSGSNEMLLGETGEYFSKEMHRKKDELSHADQVAASKRVGWKIKDNKVPEVTEHDCLYNNFNTCPYLTKKGRCRNLEGCNFKD